MSIKDAHKVGQPVTVCDPLATSQDCPQTGLMVEPGAHPGAVHFSGSLSIFHPSVRKTRPTFAFEPGIATSAVVLIPSTIYPQHVPYTLHKHTHTRTRAHVHTHMHHDP